MIIQNLYKNIIGNWKLEVNKKILLSLCLLLFSFCAVSQDSIPANVPVTEKKNLEFQEFFFKALSEKAIRNYQKAIDNLEECNTLIPNNKAVLFELSKNYLLLNKPFEALEYGNLALKKDPENLWVLEHLVATHKKDRNYSDAIKLQEKIAKTHPKKKQDLVFLHLQNRDYVSAKKTLNELENEKLLSARLRRIKATLEKPKTVKKTKELPKTNPQNLDLVKQFESDKSFNSLKLLLEKLDSENASELTKYSQNGIGLFPAQPFVYLMNGKALNKQKQYKKALESLQNGIDFVIDDPKTEAIFYTEMANAYQGLGKTKEADKFRKKAKQ